MIWVMSIAAFIVGFGLGFKLGIKTAIQGLRDMCEGKDSKITEVYRHALELYGWTPPRR